MHRRAYQELGLGWTYEAIDTTTEQLAEIFNRKTDDGHDYWSGLSLTMPLKRVVPRLVDELSTTADGLQVANTVVFSHGRRKAHNTDVPGAVAALREAGVQRVRTVRILGGGATATSMAYAAIRLGATYIEYRVRTPERAEAAAKFTRDRGVAAIVATLDQPMLDVVDVVVSTVPDHAIGSRAHEHVDAANAVFDAIYDPWPTHLASAAIGRGRTLVGGLDLLAHQAAGQVRLMTGCGVDADILRSAAHAELARRP